MAQTKQAKGLPDEAVALAIATEGAQTAGIAEMEQLLDDWSSQG
jgi:uncharacterized protein (DUF305 family)